jgi:hypothetical protein
MAKSSGLGSVQLVDDAAGTPRTISNDITNFTFSTPRNPQDVTGVDKFANERILLLADYSNTLNGVFNPAANASHDVFKTVTSTSVARTSDIGMISGGGTPHLVCEVLYTDYQITRANTGDLTWQVPGVLSDGTVPTWS